MKLIILGAGGYGRTVADVASQIGRYSEIYFLDDNNPEAIGKCADYEKYIDSDTEIYPAFGKNEGRLAWIERLEKAGANIPVIIHESAYISPTVTLGKGTVVLPRAVINTNTKIEKGCIINCGAIIDHDCVIENGCHICLGAIVKAENRIPRCMKLEAATVIENRKYPLRGDK